jgi:hypothetical protein
LVASASSARAEDVAPEDRAFVRVVADNNAFFVGEEIRVRLQVGIDRAFFRDHAVQPYQQRLDVPVIVTTGYPIHGPSNGYAWPIADPKRFTFVLDASIASASGVESVTRSGRPFDVYEVVRSLRPLGAGELDVPAPTLRFEHAERFEDDFVHERAPVGRRETVVRGAPLVLHVRALPTEGRPPEFTGAIGKFTIVSDAAPRDVAVGESIKLRLTVGGDATSFEAPRVADLDGFHVYGVIEHPRGTFEYDVAPLRDDVTELPPIAFAYFDPDAAAYRVVKTDAIPLRVRPSATPSRPTTDVSAQAPSPLRWVVLETAAAGLAVVCIVLVRRARARRARDAETPHVREAAAAFRARVDGDDADAFAAFVAACLRCSPAAVISPDLGARLVAAGAPTDDADRAAALLERLVAARYGGDASSDDAAAARAVVDELETALSTAAR